MNIEIVLSDNKIEYTSTTYGKNKLHFLICSPNNIFLTSL